MTYTYAVLEVSHSAYFEIKEKLEKAGYVDQFHDEGRDGVVIDMHGLALKDQGSRIVLDARRMCRPRDEPLA